MSGNNRWGANYNVRTIQRCHGIETLISSEPFLMKRQESIYSFSQLLVNIWTKWVIKSLLDDQSSGRKYEESKPALPYLPNPSVRARYDTRWIFKRSLTGLNSEFSFAETSCLTKAEEPSLPYYLPIPGGRIIGFIRFSMVLVLCEMQSVSSSIRTRVAVSISFDDNHYTTGSSFTPNI